jgi:ABC-2 type transport system ATP-binding protein
MSVVVTRDLSKTYGRRRGISNVNLTISEGEIYGFLGPNGAGKSTSIRVLLGFLKASSGAATVLGRDCWADGHTIRKDVGYVAGDVRLYPWLTARKAFSIVGSIRHRNLLQPGLDLAERFALEPDLPVRKMSRGNRQKVALVMALVHRPKLLILDEPTSGLDPLMQDTLAECLREMSVAGSTVFFSSHTLSEVESLCDRVAIVRDGRIVADEALQVLKSQAPRTVSLRFRDEVDVQAVDWPEFLQVQHCHRSECQLQMTGPATELVKWAAGQDLEDISIGQPSLEALFRGYYSSAESQD